MSAPATEYAVEVTEEVAQDFVANYFGPIDLGHKSRNQCFRRVAQQISRHPGGTLPDKFSDPADYAAMDRLMNRPEATHESMLPAALPTDAGEDAGLPGCGAGAPRHDRAGLFGEESPGLGGGRQRPRQRLFMPQLVGDRPGAAGSVRLGVADSCISAWPCRARKG